MRIPHSCKKLRNRVSLFEIVQNASSFHEELQFSQWGADGFPTDTILKITMSTLAIILSNIAYFAPTDQSKYT